MQFSNSFERLIPKVTDKNFISCAIDLFRYQAQNNPLYHQYIKNLSVAPEEVTSLEQIPFLPIEFFKTNEIKTGTWTHEKRFLSSGTTGSQRSCHLIKNLAFYQQLAVSGFERFYNKLENTTILALLPSYQAQENSSLIAMVDYFINSTNDSKSGYVTVQNIEQNLDRACKDNKSVLLIGVSYALLDVVCQFDLKCNLIVMETGGMKGRKKELTREELHKTLKNRFNRDCIHSEYGMTELFSQAYASSNGDFSCPPWMKVLIRDLNDPFKFINPGGTGGINVIDLANVHTCAFIETKDIGQLTYSGKFKVLGRFDNSDLRGCNLLMV